MEGRTFRPKSKQILKGRPRKEVEAATILFQGSLSLHGLRHTTMLCDGDSRSFNAIDEATVYSFIPVKKEDCTNHVQMHMGTARRNLVKKRNSGEHGQRIVLKDG